MLTVSGSASAQETASSYFDRPRAAKTFFPRYQLDAPAKQARRAIDRGSRNSYFIENAASGEQVRFFSADSKQRFGFAAGGVNIRLNSGSAGLQPIGFAFANFVEPQGQDLIAMPVEVSELGSGRSRSVPRRLRELRYEQAFNGVDAMFRLRGNRLEQTLVVRPGAEVSEIDFSYSGVEHLKLLANGSLEVIAGRASVRYAKPECSEQAPDGAEAAPCMYQMTGLRSFGIFLPAGRRPELALRVFSEIALP